VVRLSAQPRENLPNRANGGEREAGVRNIAYLHVYTEDVVQPGGINVGGWSQQFLNGESTRSV